MGEDLMTTIAAQQAYTPADPPLQLSLLVDWSYVTKRWNAKNVGFFFYLPRTVSHALVLLTVTASLSRTNDRARWVNGAREHPPVNAEDEEISAELKPP